MERFITVLLLALGVGLILTPVGDAKDQSNNVHSHSFQFRVLDGATWQPGEIPHTKGKAMTSLCVPVQIFDQDSSQPLGSGKVCLSGQDKQPEALSLWDLTVYMNFNTKDTLVLSIPDTTVVNLTRAMASSPRSNPMVISGASREGTSPVLSGTGKFHGAQGMVDFFAVVDTKALAAGETARKVPILGDIPILGRLFLSREIPTIAR